jgi:hypothetical protein
MVFPLPAKPINRSAYTSVLVSVFVLTSWSIFLFINPPPTWLLRFGMCFLLCSLLCTHSCYGTPWKPGAVYARVLSTPLPYAE